MEIEAKFAVPDRATFQRLLEVQELAGLTLSAARSIALHDQYLDTAAGAFLRGGYACRVRVANGGRLLTLKSLTPAQGGMHVREELEARLPSGTSLAVADWPEGDATTLARRLSRGQPLELLFQLRQERHQRLAIPAGSHLAAVELSIDHTRIVAAGEDALLGVEVELLPAGELSVLQALANALQQRWGLRPESMSKFEWGLAQARPELVPLIHAR